MKTLIKAARDVRENAYAPFSGYKVGAAVLTESGEIISGCNVESTSYGLTCCAERNALYTATAKGHIKFKALAVVTRNGGSPCGACRQVIWDLCGNIPVYVADTDGSVETHTAGELLPEAFGEDKLK